MVELEAGTKLWGEKPSGRLTTMKSEKLIYKRLTDKTSFHPTTMGAETTFCNESRIRGRLNGVHFTKQISLNLSSSVVEMFVSRQFHDFHTFHINAHQLFWTIYESVNGLHAVSQWGVQPNYYFENQFKN